MPMTLYGPIKLASSHVTCWKCKARTPVHALVPSDLDDHGENGDSGLGRIGEGVFLYDIEEGDMPKQLVSALRHHAPNYKPLHSRTRGSAAWANECTACGALQGSFFLHMEPDGAFFGMPRDHAGDVQTLLDGDVLLDDASFGLG